MLIIVHSGMNSVNRTAALTAHKAVTMLNKKAL